MSWAGAGHNADWLERGRLVQVKGDNRWCPRFQGTWLKARRARVVVTIIWSTWGCLRSTRGICTGLGLLKCFLCRPNRTVTLAPAWLNEAKQSERKCCSCKERAAVVLWFMVWPSLLLEEICRGAVGKVWLLTPPHWLTARASVVTYSDSYYHICTAPVGAFCRVRLCGQSETRWWNGSWEKGHNAGHVEKCWRTWRIQGWNLKITHPPICRVIQIHSYPYPMLLKGRDLVPTSIHWWRDKGAP